MSELFPPIEPFESGLLEVGEGHRVYWESCGNPNGLPAILLHGGPGSGCSVNQRRLFDPERYRIVLFDQRGCGRSLPLASEPDAVLSANTTQHLLEDIERLRILHGADRWTMLGLSWGTTLGLAYAQRWPRHVERLVLASVSTTSRREIDWLTVDVGRIFPREWERFANAVPPSLRSARLVDAYATLLADADPSVRERAALEWCTWEDAHISLAPDSQPNPKYGDPAFRLRFARLVTHYWRHDAFLGPNELLENAALLAGIPGVLIHGRYDVSSPLETAWQLSQRWAGSKLVVIDDAGHSGNDAFLRAMLDAVNHK